MSGCQNYVFAEINKNSEYFWWEEVEWGRQFPISCFYTLSLSDNITLSVSFISYCCTIKIKPKLSSNCDKT